ncbi:hypothetical protein Taro_011684, partial [Colocasia esculenta]|nr:hypothetical protein [Colocasia esculenta]
MAPHRRRQARDLIEQQDESDMPTQGQVQKEELVPGSVVAWAGGSGRLASGTSPSGTRAADRSRDKAKSWTHEMECTFKTMECAEEDQVRLVVYQLKGAAHECCLLAEVDGSGSRGISRGLRSNQSSMELSRADRRQFATLVVCRATSGGIARWGKSSSSSSQCSTRNSYRSTSTLPSSRHPVNSSRGSTNSSHSSSNSFSSHSSSSRTSNNSFLSTSSRRSSSSPSRRRSVGLSPRASLCFASEEFYESLVHHTPERQCDVMVDLLSGDYMRSFGYLEGVIVEVQGQQLPARLYALQLRDLVDCQQKTIQFEIPGVPVLCFQERSCQVADAYSVDVTWSAIAFAFPSLQGLTTFGVAPGVAFLVLVVLVLRWCLPVRAGDVLMVLRARRRWPFLREGPNGRVVVTTSSHTEFPIVLYFRTVAGSSFASALFVWRASGGGDAAIVVVPVASSGSPFHLYITLGPFRVSGSMGCDRENQVLGVGRGSGVVLRTNVGSLSLGRGLRALCGCCRPESAGFLSEKATGWVVAFRSRRLSLTCSGFGMWPIGPCVEALWWYLVVVGVEVELCFVEVV